MQTMTMLMLMQIQLEIRDDDGDVDADSLVIVELATKVNYLLVCIAKHRVELYHSIPFFVNIFYSIWLSVRQSVRWALFFIGTPESFELVGVTRKPFEKKIAKLTNPWLLLLAFKDSSTEFLSSSSSTVACTRIRKSFLPGQGVPKYFIQMPDWDTRLYFTKIFAFSCKHLPNEEGKPKNAE